MSPAFKNRQCEQRTVPDYADGPGTKASLKEPPAEHIPGQAQQLGYPTHSQFTRSHTKATDRSRLVIVKCFFTTQYHKPPTFLYSELN
jgi:hypothetical protein